MTGSGLIYAAIVAAWIAYLVPSWVRRGEGRTHVERSTDRMRLLRNGRTRIAPGHPEVAVEAPTARTASTARTSVSPRTARRRWRALGLLLLTLIGVGVGALLGRLAPWAPLVPAIVLVLYLRALRRSARQMALARRREQARRDVRRVAGPSPLLPVVGPHVSVRADVTVPAAATGAVAERRAATAPRTAAVSTAVAAARGDTWEPQPVPLPTYVTAPKASRPIRTIDLTTPGSWTSGRLDPLAVGTPMPGWVGAPGGAAAEAPAEAPASPYPAATPAAEDPPTGEIEVPRAVGD